MRIFHYVEIENFKTFGDKQKIELDHPAVLIGPNNSGKTTAIQAIALWSQALKTWYDSRKNSTAQKRTSTPLNRLAIVSVPVLTTKYFWANTKTRIGNSDIYLVITIGIKWKESILPVKMKFRNQGDELVYATPDEEALDNLDLLEFAANLNVELLYPMSGLETDEPIATPLHINDLMGQGRTAQVLRNLCLMVYKSNATDWKKIQSLVKRLFSVDLGIPRENSRGKIELLYTQFGLKNDLEISMSGRGFQQILLIFSYLYSHKNSVLLIDEPDAHLEILRQKQVYILLRDIASLNQSQVIIVTHSEVILEEALENNLTLLIDGKADDIAAKSNIRNTLKHFGAEHYIKARERGYVLYVEGSTDVDMLRSFADKINHPVSKIWDERTNVYYVQDNYPLETMESALERVEGGFGISPIKHFGCLRGMITGLKGLAILDNDGRDRQDSESGGLDIRYWKRYEAENYFITPKLLMDYASREYEDIEKKGLFAVKHYEIEDVVNNLVLERIFGNNEKDFNTYRSLTGDAAQLIWDTKTTHIKMSKFAEDFFALIAEKFHDTILLKKGEFHRLINYCEITFDQEVNEKLDLLYSLFYRE
jgi:predicted ATPase